MPDRVHGKKITIDDREVERFFLSRAQRDRTLGPVVAMLFQDSDPALALARDRYEKTVLLPVIAPTVTDRVLDIGCGLGRWTGDLADKVAYYVGSDPITPLIEVARRKYARRNNVEFHVCGAEEISLERLSETADFTIILVAGVLQYVNDTVCEEAFRRALSCAAQACRISIRVPIGIEGRFTLNGVWSEELDHEYSAIYRSRAEYLGWFDQIFEPTGFSLRREFPLYPEALNNRVETRQHVFLLERV